MWRFVYVLQVAAVVWSLPLDNGVDWSFELGPEDGHGSEEESFTADLNSFWKELAALSGKFAAGPSNGTGEKVAQWTESSGVNPEEVGEYFQGDIVVPASARNGLRAKSARWPEGIVPYKIQGSFSSADRQMIERAVKAYQQSTCIRWRPATGAERDYVYFTNENTGCWSSVGRVGGPQQLNLQTPGCLSSLGTPVHEMMHAVGFLHEQNRADRDDHVRINWPNIMPGREINFNKASDKDTYAYKVKYDYSSVMHYSKLAFSRNGLTTIDPLESGKEIGQRKGFSKGDITKINNMYNTECRKRKKSGK